MTPAPSPDRGEATILGPGSRAIASSADVFYGLPAPVAARRLRDARRPCSSTSSSTGFPRSAKRSCSNSPSASPEKAPARGRDPGDALPRDPDHRLLGAARRRHGRLPRGVRAQGALVQPRCSRSTSRTSPAVPSIVYGILGLAFIVRGLDLGRVLLAGALILTLLVLPTVIVASREAIRAVPDSVRQGAYALGATRWQVVARQVLPASIPGIATGSILSVSSGIGETAPLLLVGALTFVSINPSAPRAVHGAADPDLPVDQRAAGGVQVPRGRRDHRPARDAARPERVRDLAPKPLPEEVVIDDRDIDRRIGTLRGLEAARPRAAGGRPTSRRVGLRRRRLQRLLRRRPRPPDVTMDVYREPRSPRSSARPAAARARSSAASTG